MIQVASRESILRPSGGILTNGNGNPDRAAAVLGFTNSVARLAVFGHQTSERRAVSGCIARLLG